MGYSPQRRRRSKCMDKHFLRLSRRDVQWKSVNRTTMKVQLSSGNKHHLSGTLVSSSRNSRHLWHFFFFFFTHSAVQWLYLPNLKASAIIVLLSCPVREHNYQTMTRFQTVSCCVCRLSLRAFVQQETAGYGRVFCVNLTPRDVNSELCFTSSAVCFVIL